jgi:hypothetical protein
MAILGESVVRVFGANYVFLRCGYAGLADSVTVDQGATKVTVVSPASGGPTLTLGSASSTGTKTVTIAAGGLNAGGAIVILVNGGKSVGGFKGEL